jgi:uncharacterized protein (DUF983 family)
MLKRRNKFIEADNAFVLTGTVLVILAIVVGGFLFMAYMVSQITNIAIAIVIMGVVILAIGAGVMLLRKGLSGIFPSRGG